uniref:RRM domain-containing protein n=1 Tax=Kalanchoe fedtschenkoi TaxID=63787 RepID=A0A7N0T3N1_KALFE
MMQSTNGSDQSQQQHQQQPQQMTQQQQQQQQQQWLQYQQQWMGSMGQYPAAAAAMAMQQQQMMMMMYPQQYLPYVNQSHPQQRYYQNQQGSAAAGAVNGEEDEVKTIWIGDLKGWMDEAYLHSCFAPTGEVGTVKIIRNKQTGQSEGYGFIEFLSRAAAEEVLKTYTGSTMPSTEQPYRINWATFSAAERRASSDGGSDLSVFVGDLAPDVTDVILQETFASNYPSVKGAKVVVDVNSGRSKGYGFVRFSDENERARAIAEMNGMYCLSRPMRLGIATPKKSVGYQQQQQQQYPSQAVVLSGGSRSNGAVHQAAQFGNDPTNTTIFVGGIDSETTDADLRQPFSQFGDILNIKIPIGKGCAFVQFATRSEAEAAIEGLNGTIIGNQAVRLSWGRSPANRQWRNDQSNQWNGGYYGGGQSYNNGYGHPMQHNQDPYASAAAYSTS